MRVLMPFILFTFFISCHKVDEKYSYSGMKPEHLCVQYRVSIKENNKNILTRDTLTSVKWDTTSAQWFFSYFYSDVLVIDLLNVCERLTEKLANNKVSSTSTLENLNKMGNADWHYIGSFNLYFKNGATETINYYVGIKEVDKNILKYIRVFEYKGKYFLYKETGITIKV